MKAKKENKVYTIESEAEKQRYLKAGYDIYDNEGKIITYSPLKKIAYSEYVKLEQENAALRARIAELESMQGETEAVTEAEEEPAEGKRKSGSKKAGE